jgi:hypothetical protein
MELLNCLCFSQPSGVAMKAGHMVYLGRYLVYLNHLTTYHLPPTILHITKAGKRAAFGEFLLKPPRRRRCLLILQAVRC